MVYSQPSGHYPAQPQSTSAPVNVQPQSTPAPVNVQPQSTPASVNVQPQAQTPVVMNMNFPMFFQPYAPMMNSQVMYPTPQQAQHDYQTQMQLNVQYKALPQMLRQMKFFPQKNLPPQQLFYPEAVFGPMGHFNHYQPPALLPVVQHPVQVSAANCEAGASISHQQVQHDGEVVPQHMNYEAGSCIPEGTAGNSQQLPAGMQNLLSHGAETALDSNFFVPQAMNLEPGESTSEGMIGNSQSLFGELQNYPSHGSGETDMNQEFFDRPEEVAPVSEEQIVPAHETCHTYRKTFLQTDADPDAVKEESSLQLRRLENTKRFFKRDRDMKKQIGKLLKKLKEQSKCARWNDNKHVRDFAKDHKDVHQNWESVNSLLSFVSIASDVLEKEGQNASPRQDARIPLEQRRSYMLVLNLIRAVETMTKKSFDEIWSVDFGKLIESQSLLCAMQRFKINNVYVKSLSSLRSHQRPETKKFIESLQQNFVQIRTTATPDQLQSFIEYMHEVSKLFKIEMACQGPRTKWLTQDCVRSLDFLKSSKFDPKNALAFKSFDTMVRALRFSVLSYKMMQAPGCRLGQNVSHDRTERGSHVVRCRLKRVCNCERQGFEFVKFLVQIKTTNAVGINSIDVRRDYKSPKKDKSSKQGKKPSKQIAEKQERKLSGLLCYVVTPTALQAEQLLQLLIAWGERKEVRDMVFARYPELLEAQADDLTDEADRARSKERQCIIRKAKSIPDRKDLLDSQLNLSQHMRMRLDAGVVFNEAIERDEATRMRLCEGIMAENWRWTCHALERQKAMYHFDFAHEKDTREKNPDATVYNYKRYLYNVPVPTEI